MNFPEVKFIDVEEQPSGALIAKSIGKNIPVYGSAPYFEARLTAYPKLPFRGVVSFWFPSNLSPSSITANTIDQWLPIQDGSKTRWIFSHKNRQTSRFETPFYNSTGEFQISDGNLILNIIVDVNLFTKEDLEEALSDFKGELLKIIFSQSPIFLKLKNNATFPLLTDEAYNNLYTCIRFLEQLIPHLKTRLIQHESNCAIHKAKPNPKGFIEYITNPLRRSVSSKSYKNSYDTGENRFILSCAKNLLTTIKGITELQSTWCREFKIKLNCYKNINHIAKEDNIPQKDINQLKERLERDLFTNKEIYDKIHNQDISKLADFVQKNILLLKKRKIQTIASTYNPMTIAQNNHYRKFYKSYIKFIKHWTYESSDLVNDLDRYFSKINIPTLPYFYEKWCYIQIINTLIYRYNLIPNNKGWQKEIVTACIKDEHNISLSFAVDSHSLTLTYQGTISVFSSEHNYVKTYRPDFIIELDQSRWVLDAKFRTHSSNNTLVSLAQTLANEKCYSLSDTASVYILHSAPSVGASNATAINRWSAFCNYGADNNHKYGHIYLSPEKKYKFVTLENLVRLFTLIFQANDIVLCPNCGIPMNRIPGIGFRASTPFECPICSHRCFKTHCIHCQRTLWKNGSYWTYHHFRETSGNVLCPRCHQDL